MTHPGEPTPSAKESGEFPVPRRRTGERLRVFVGDVHGCAEELDALLEELGYDAAVHELWFVGDLVNRGPDSLGALRRAHEIADGVVLGNHDLHLLRRIDGFRGAEPRDTLDDILAATDRDRLVGWLRSRPFMHVWDDLVLVHAGIHPAWTDLEAAARRLGRACEWDGDPLQHEAPRFATLVRHCDADGELGPAVVGDGGPHVPWDSLYRGTRPVVFGHWAQRGLVRTSRVRGLDTGCVWGGALTAWIAEEDRLVSVTARRAYQDIDRMA